MQNRWEDFKALNAKVVAISFVKPHRLSEYLSTAPSPFPVLCDPTRALYKAFGLGKVSSFYRLLTLKAILSFVRQHLRGNRQKPVKEDIYQLGGDFIVNTDGNILFAHPAKDSADRASVKELLRALRGK